MATIRSNFIPNPTEHTLTLPADVETPSEGIALFFDKSVAGNPLSFKDSDGNVTNILNGATIQAKGLIYSSANFTVVEAADGVVDELQGYWLFVATVSTGNKGEVWYKTDGTGAGSFYKVWDYVNAPHTFEVQTPASAGFISSNGTYIKQGNSWTPYGALYAVSIIDSEAGFDTLKASTIDSTQGLYLINIAYAAESVTTGDVWLKDIDDSFIKQWHFAEAPNTFGVGTSVYSKVSGAWAEVGSGGGGGDFSYPTFTIGDADGGLAGDIVEIDSNGKVINIAQTIAGTGTGIIDVGKPNYPMTTTSTNSMGMALIDGSVVQLNSNVHMQEANLIMGSVSDTAVTYGDNLDKTDYSWLEAYPGGFLYPNNGIQWDADKVVFIIPRWNSDTYYRPLLVCAQKANSLQFNNIGYKILGYVCNTYGVGVARCNGKYGLMINHDYANSAYRILYISNDFSGGLNDWVEVNMYTLSGDHSSPAIAHIGSDHTYSHYVAAEFSADNGTLRLLTMYQTSTSQPFTHSIPSFTGLGNLYQYISILPFQKTVQQASFDVSYYVIFFSSFNFVRAQKIKQTADAGYTYLMPNPDTTNKFIVINNPGHSSTEEIYTFAAMYLHPTVGYHMRMYVYTVNISTGVFTLIQQGGEDYYEVLNSSECDFYTSVPRFAGCSAPFEGNGYCYVQYLDGVNSSKAALAIIKMDGATVVNTSGWDGILQESGLLDAEVPVALRGMLSTVHTGLAPGANMYLDGDGEITATYTVHPLGQAISDTKINLVSQLLTTPDNNGGYQDQILNQNMLNRISTDYYGELALRQNGELKITVGDQVRLYTIPTSDPLIVGAIWNNLGALKLSEGA